MQAKFSCVQPGPHDEVVVQPLPVLHTAVASVEIVPPNWVHSCLVRFVELIFFGGLVT